MKLLLVCLALVACSVAALPDGILQVVDHPLSGTYCAEGETLGQCLEEIQEALGEVRDFISAENADIEERPARKPSSPHAFPLACVLRLRHTRRHNGEEEEQDGSSEDTTNGPTESRPRPNRGRRNRTDVERPPRPVGIGRLGATRKVLQGLRRTVAQATPLPNTVQRMLGSLCRRVNAANAEASSDAEDVVKPVASQSEGNTDESEVAEPTDEGYTEVAVSSTAARRPGGRGERRGSKRRGEGRQSQGDADATRRPRLRPTGSSDERGDEADGGRRSPGRGSSDGPGGRRQRGGSRPPRPRPTESSDEERGNNSRRGRPGRLGRPRRPGSNTEASEAPSSEVGTTPEPRGRPRGFWRFFQLG